MVGTHLTILTAATPNGPEAHWPLLEITGRNKYDYALKWRLGFHSRIQFNDVKPWGERQNMIKHALQHTDWLWFMGADTLVTNFNIDARQFCDPAYHVVITVDVNGINNDSLFIRNSTEAGGWIDRVFGLRHRAPDDQTAMAWAMKATPRLRVKKVPQRQFNSYLYDEYPYHPPEKVEAAGGSWEPGDFVIHFPGLPIGRRMELALRYKDAWKEVR